MTVLHSQIDGNSADFENNYQSMLSAVDEFRLIEQAVIEKAKSKQARYKKRGLLTPRERLAHLLDTGAPFLEFSTLCGYLQEDDTDGSAAGGSCIAGIGYVQKTMCAIIVDDYLTKGGTITQLGSMKRLRMLEVAMQQRLPLIVLAQSGGGNLTSLGDWFAFSGRGFAMQAKLSAAGIPQVTVVHGSATAGGAYQPGLSDYVIMIRNQSTVYLAGPPLLKAATGEIATDEEIGGAQMHAQVAGTADYLAENDADGVRIAREVVGTLKWHSSVQLDSQIVEPLLKKEHLLGVVSQDAKQPFDMREIIACLADGSDFVEFKAQYDMGTVCGQINVHGQACAVIANNAPITAKGAAKAAQFIQLCEQVGTPLLFLHNTTGFMVGTQAEQSGIIKHGSKLIQAVTNASVPKITIIVAGSYGAGNYAMCGKAIDPDFIFAWPRSVVSVMGPEQAGSVVRNVAQAKLQRQTKEALDEATLAQLDALEAKTKQAMQERSGALANTARMWDDGLIDPRDSRDIVGFLLLVCNQAKGRQVRQSNFGVARF